MLPDEPEFERAGSFDPGDPVSVAHEDQQRARAHDLLREARSWLLVTIKQGPAPQVILEGSTEKPILMDGSFNIAAEYTDAFRIGLRKMTDQLDQVDAQEDDQG